MTASTIEAMNDVWNNVVDQFDQLFTVDDVVIAPLRCSLSDDDSHEEQHAIVTFKKNLSPIVPYERKIDSSTTETENAKGLVASALKLQQHRRDLEELDILVAKDCSRSIMTSSTAKTESTASTSTSGSLYNRNARDLDMALEQMVNGTVDKGSNKCEEVSILRMFPCSQDEFTQASSSSTISSFYSKEETMKKESLRKYFARQLSGTPRRFRSTTSKKNKIDTKMKKNSYGLTSKQPKLSPIGTMSANSSKNRAEI